jgi:hypothetical protein
MFLKLASSCRNLDDDVLVAARDAGLAQTELVDPAVDDVLRLPDRALADLDLDAVFDAELESSRLGLRRRRGRPGTVEEPRVDLAGVRRVLHLDA